MNTISMRRVAAVSFTAVGMGLALGAGSAAQAVVIADFESPAYTENSGLGDAVDDKLVGSNGWRDLDHGASWWKDASSSIYDGDATTGSSRSPVLAGSQSVWIGAGGNLGGYTRAFTTTEQDQIQNEGTVFSALIHVDHAGSNPTSGLHEFWLSAQNSIQNTSAGIRLDESSDTFNVYNGSSNGTAVSFSGNTTYLLEIATQIIDPTGTNNDAFEAFVTDVTNGGARTSLGVYSVNLDGLAAGGIMLVDRSTGIGASWDNITVAVPEPASMTLLALGGLAMLRRRRRA